MRRVKVCAVHGCPKLAPCPTHARPAGQPWSNGRDRQAQHRFRTQVLERDRYRCRRCGRHDPTGKTLEAHHIRPGYQLEAGITVCDARNGACHQAIDRNAR